MTCDNTRLFRHQNNIYKIRIDIASSSQELRDAVSFETIKPAIRSVLYAEERGRHISKIEIEDFVVSYTKKYWRASEKLGFKQYGKILEAYPYLLIFNVDYNFPHRRTASHETDHSRSQIAVSTKDRDIPSASNNRNSSRGKSTVLSKLNLPREWLASNQGRSSKRHPVVVLEKLHLPVSKKPDNGFQENKLPVRTSPRRNINKHDSSLDETPERRKRHRDTISDEKLPLCRAAKVPKLSSGKGGNAYHSPVKAFAQNSRSKMPAGNRLSKENDKLNGRPRFVTDLGDDLSMSPVIPLQKIDQTAKYSFSSNARFSKPDSLRSPGGKSRILPIRTECSTIEDAEMGENGKLQSSGSPCCPKEKRKRTSSGFWQLLETIMTPVKLFTRKRSK